MAGVRYRIVPTYNTEYHIQIKRFWLWWTLKDGYEYSSPREFTKEAAERWIDNDIKRRADDAAHMSYPAKEYP